VPPDDEQPPGDYDYYYDQPATTAKGIPARFYVKVEQNDYLLRKQNEAILALLQWYMSTLQAGPDAE
jgi:hypothetical protein